MTAIDLDAYLQRIGYAGERAPTLAALRALHLRHTQAIAFESLDPRMGRPVRLDLPSLEEKLVRGGRGGYCFEHNHLFRHALEAFGFEVRGLAGRVFWNVPEGTVAPRSHMVLRVAVEGTPYIADVGFGGMTLTGPLRLEPKVEQATPHEVFRVDRSGDELALEVHLSDAWRTLYRFSLQEQLAPDYEVANWYVSTHPSSRFVRNLVVARPAPGRRYALLNNELTVRYLDGRSEKQHLTSASALREALEGTFDLRLPGGSELDALLEQVSSG